MALFLCTISIAAEESQNELYEELYQNSDAQEITSLLPESVRDSFEGLDIDLSDADWVNRLTMGNLFTHFWELITTGWKQPLQTGGCVMAIVLIAAAFLSFSSEKTDGKTAGYAAVVTVCGTVLPVIYRTLLTSVEVLRSMAAFMLAFVPIFIGIIALSGAAKTAFSAGGLLLGVTELLNGIANHILLPFLGGYFAVGICSGVSPLLDQNNFAEGLKKTAVWIMTLCGTLFTAFLGIQTAVNASADGLAMKTAKFFVGTTVPIAGSVLSEALSTVHASIGLMRNSVGMYGVAVLIFLVAPVVLELLLWRFVLSLCTAMCDFFNLKTVSSVLKTINGLFGLLESVLLFSSSMLIISLGVVISAGKNL
ncbi:MAG: hypothetical protein IKI29_06200 [Clostridia bacterium]|nr:hypothetical protein [Clostridia bacterium]